MANNSLSENYDILGSLSLDELYQLPSSTLYRFLSSLRKDRYEPSERIVFYNYGKITDNLLDHLCWAIKYLDISDYFILVISNQLRTVEFLKDKIPVELVNHPEISNQVSDKIFGSQNPYCAHAWAGIHLSPDGTARACCDSKQWIRKPNGELYNINNDSIMEILDSQWMKDFRNSFRNNEKHPNCSSCFSREQVGQESRRTIAPYKLENVYGLIDWEDEGQLMYFGGHLGNLCNFKCRICNESYSSSIANEKLATLPKQDQKTSRYYLANKNSNWVMSDEFWQRLKEEDGIINFEILGGEPFYLKQNIEFVKWLAKSNRGKQSILYFSTNGSSFPLKDYIKDFYRVEVTVSIDNIGEMFELERPGLKWKNIENNVKIMIEHQKNLPNFKLDVCITANIQNIYYLPETLNWIRDIGFNSYYINYVHFPEEMSLNKLTAAAQNLILDKFSTINFDAFQKDTIGVVDFVKNAELSDGTEFCKKMKELDELRNQDFRKTHPDIAKAMGYE